SRSSVIRSRAVFFPRRCCLSWAVASASSSRWRRRVRSPILPTVVGPGSLEDVTPSRLTVPGPRLREGPRPCWPPLFVADRQALARWAGLWLLDELHGGQRHTVLTDR